jgi:hypothetical protein
MMRLFTIAEARHGEIVKAAFIGSLLGNAARYAVKNPLKTFGGVLTAQQVKGDAQKMMGMAGRGLPGTIPTPSVTF